jgi:hypothetical protein
MRIEEVKAVLELHRCSGGKATAEQIHKLILLSGRIKRLTGYGLRDLSARQLRAYQRAMGEASKLAIEIGAIDAMRNKGVVIVWPHCDPTEL